MSGELMRIGVLKTGEVREQLQAAHGEYPEMFERLLAAVEPRFSFHTWSVVDGEFPADLKAADGWIITGSRHGVYDGLPWIPRLKAVIRDLYAARSPMVGICFGHQIMAEALGGKVIKSEKGWGVGAHAYALTDRPPFAEAAPPELAFCAMHQDQVVEKPPEASVFMSSDFCPYAGFVYGDQAFSVQPHPEFSPEFEADLLTLLRDEGLVEAERANAGLASLQGSPLDAKQAALWMRNFFLASRA